MVPIEGLGLESVNSLMKVRSLGKTLMDKIIESLVITPHGFESKRFVIIAMESFG